MELKHEIDDLFDFDASLSVIFSEMTIGEAAHVLANLSVQAAVDTRMESSPAGDHLLSQSQLAMWTVHHLDPSSEAYNLTLAIAFEQSISSQRLRDALRRVIAKHDQLRARYFSSSNGARRRSVPLKSMDAYLREIDASDWDDAELDEALTREAKVSFNLEEAPPIRFLHFRRERRGSVFLAVAHHIAIDLWSMISLLNELNEFYQDDFNVPEEQSFDKFDEFVQDEAEYLKSDVAKNDLKYWATRLGGLLPHLNLPYDGAEPDSTSYLGESYGFEIQQNVARPVKNVAGREGASTFSLLLAGYYIFLGQLSGQNDLIVGTPTSGRVSARDREIVGNFVNPVAIRMSLAGEDRFDEFLNM